MARSRTDARDVSVTCLEGSYIMTRGGSGCEAPQAPLSLTVKRRVFFMLSITVVIQLIFLDSITPS